MYSALLRELIIYLKDSRPDADQIAMFLALRTLSSFKTIHLYMGSLDQNGTINKLASFGVTDEDSEFFNSFSLNYKIPFCESTKCDKTIFLNSDANFIGQYPDMTRLTNITKDWSTTVSWSMPRYGGCAAFFTEQIPCKKETKDFFNNLGAILSLYLTFQKTSTVNSGENGPDETTLTKRQKVILELIEKGMTNSEIAERIGYSTSLVRQETVQIYSVLQVTGRGQIIG